MRSAHADRLWAIGGAVGAVLLLAVGWFFLVSPQYGETRSLNDQANTAEVKLGSLQRKLVDLRQQNADLPRYKAELETAHRALPAAPESSDFLRELQAAGENAGVSVTGLQVGSRSAIPGATGGVYALPVGLTVVGLDAGLEKFLDQLQRVQPRAVLIKAASKTVEKGATTLTLSLHAFVAPPVAAVPATADKSGAATPTPSPAN